MSAPPPSLVLLGPQRLRPTVGSVVRAAGIRGPVALVSAGWQEREAEAEELREHLRRKVANLELYRRAEEVFSDDPELFAAHRARQDRLRALQRLYRLRLSHSLDAARALLAESDDGDLLEIERRSAIEEVRHLDAHNASRIRAVHREFEERWLPSVRPVVARHREALAEFLAGCGALAIAGGHVAVLLNRIRLFDLLGLAGGLPLLAWSAGAMVLAERIVLYHDDPPQGPGNAEVLDVGLGVVPGLLPLPHARRRLRLKDRLRVALFARRFAPERSLVMDDGAVLGIAGPLAGRARRVSRLDPAGTVEAVRDAREVGG